MNPIPISPFIDKHSKSLAKIGGGWGGGWDAVGDEFTPEVV